MPKEGLELDAALTAASRPFQNRHWSSGEREIDDVKHTLDSRTSGHTVFVCVCVRVCAGGDLQSLLLKRRLCRTLNLGAVYSDVNLQ